MRYEEIEPYLIDYLNGNVEEEVEYRIKAYLQENPDFQEELDELRSTMEYMEEVPLVEPHPSLKMNFYTMLNEYKAETQKAVKVSLWEQAMNYMASKLFVRGFSMAGLAVVLFLSGYWLAKVNIYQETSQEAVSMKKETQPTQADEIRDEESKDIPEKSKIEVKEDVVATAELQNLESNKTLVPKPQKMMSGSMDYDDKANHDVLTYEKATVIAPTQHLVKTSTTANPEITNNAGISVDNELTAEVITKNDLETEESGERIQRIYTKLNKSKKLDEVIATLIAIMNTDPSPNVRIAAIDALESFVTHQKVQNGILQSLENQDSPNVQLAAIDLIVKYNIKSGKKSLKKLLEKPDLNPVVREQVEMAFYSF
jgi:hypothetical protein